MKKFNLFLLFFLVFSLLFLSPKAFALQKAYIMKIEYSINDLNFGNWNGSKGKIAEVLDYNPEKDNDKVYFISPYLPLTMKDGSNAITNFKYDGGYIAKINTNVATTLTLYTRYTVKNIGDSPLEGIKASVTGDYYGFKDGTGKHTREDWKKDGWFIKRLDSDGPLLENAISTELYATNIKQFPNGYLWKPIMLGWDYNNLFGNENLGFVPILKTEGTNFYPPSIDCDIDPLPNSPSPAAYCHWQGSVWKCPIPPAIEDIKIDYGGTYKTKCTLRNFSANDSYTRVNSDFETRLSWLGFLRGGVAHNAAYIHTFPSEIITLQEAGTAGDSMIIYREITINDSSSDPGHKNINFSQLSSSHTFYSCDAGCNNISLSINDSPVFGRGPGKYLGIDDSGTFSETYIAPNDKPAYKFSFNLFNPDTKYNEAVLGADYDIDIQILEDGATWNQDGSTAVFDPTTGGRRHYTISVSGLKQDVPTFPGSFAADWSTYQKEDSYPFFHEILDIQDLCSAAQKYQLYITTIWKGVNIPGHPLAGTDQPMDQVVRNFVPALDLQLSPVTLSGTYEATTTNSIRNFSSKVLTVQLQLSDDISDPNFIIDLSDNPYLCSPPIANTLCFTLNPGETPFPIKFKFTGSAPSVDITGNLTGIASFQIGGGSYYTSDTAVCSIIIEKSAPPTARDLGFILPGSESCFKAYPPVTVYWTFDKPGDTQSAYSIEIDEHSDFLSLEVPPVNRSSNSQSFVFQNPGERLSWGKTYYWRLKVWDSGDPPTPSADWIYPPNPPGQTTLIPGTSFTTSHRWPEPDFDWSPKPAPAKEIVKFTDLSKCFDTADEQCNSWSWNFNDEEILTGSYPTPTYVFTAPGTPIVTLTATDGDDYSCSKQQSLDIGLPLPKWKEITPF